MCVCVLCFLDGRLSVSHVLGQLVGLQLHADLLVLHPALGPLVADFVCPRVLQVSELAVLLDELVEQHRRPRFDLLGPLPVEHSELSVTNRRPVRQNQLEARVHQRCTVLSSSSSSSSSCGNEERERERERERETWHVKGRERD